MAMAERLPLPPDPVIEAYKKDVDVTLLIENLKRTPQQRIDALIDLTALVTEMRKAMKTARRR